MKLVLHSYWRSSASHRVRIGLGLKGRAYEYAAVNLVKDVQHTEAYRALNPLARVPLLEITEEDGSVWSLSQSLPILEYLDERWPDAPLLPRGLHGARGAFLRARTRALAEIINSYVQPLQNLSTLRSIKKLGGDEAAWIAPIIAGGLAAYEHLVRDTARQLGQEASPFSIGDHPTIADCCLIPQMVGARRFGVDLAVHPSLLAIEEHCLALPAFANAAPDRQPDAQAK